MARNGVEGLIVSAELDNISTCCICIAAGRTATGVQDRAAVLGEGGLAAPRGLLLERTS